MRKRKRIIFKIIGVLTVMCLLCAIALASINAYVKSAAQSRIVTAQEAAELADVDCILVLGCGVHSDGTPSAMLTDRLKRAVELYDLQAAPKLLMSGDHGQTDYDEVNVMKSCAVDAGISSDDVFMDHAGFSTYESIYRAKEIFQAEKVIIVTQEYHLYRAIYIAEQLGLEAYGVSADYRSYSNQTSYEMREILARAKDFGTCVFKPEPTYLGEAIPIFGDGDITNDEI